MWKPGVDIKILISHVMGGICGVMIVIIANRGSDLRSNPGQVCISHHANTHGKGMSPTILLPAVGRLDSLTGMVMGLGEGKPWIQAC